MVKLKADFVADWIAQLRFHMSKVQGWDAEQIEGLTDGHVPIYFFESSRRKLTLRPRVIKIADNFQCSPALVAGWQALQSKIRKGEDLNPHLSIGHASLFNNDGLFSEWGVHHFHLGTEPHPKNPAYVARTDPVVFALIDSTTFCAIGVYPHGTSWEDSNIVERIHRNWPDMISKYRGKKVTGTRLDQNQRRALRRKNVNVLTPTLDGTAYMPIGGAVTCSGAKMESVIQADKWHSDIQNLQIGLENELGKLIPTFEQRGYAGEQEIEAQLKITEAGYQAFFPKYEVLANLLLEPAIETRRV